MRNDIQEIKSFLSLLISSKDQLAQIQANQPLAELYHSLLVRGLDEKQVFILLSKAVSDLNGDTVDRRRIFERFLQAVFCKNQLRQATARHLEFQRSGGFYFSWTYRGRENNDPRQIGGLSQDQAPDRAGDNFPGYLPYRRSGPASDLRQHPGSPVQRGAEQGRTDERAQGFAGIATPSWSIPPAETI